MSNCFHVHIDPQPGSGQDRFVLKEIVDGHIVRRTQFTASNFPDRLPAINAFLATTTPQVSDNAKLAIGNDAVEQLAEVRKAFATLSQLLA